MNKWLSGFCIGIIILGLSLHGLSWLSRRGNALPPLPKPNAYDELLAIAGNIKLPDIEASELTTAQVRETARQNAEVLNLMPAALRGETSVPLQTDRQWREKHDADLKKLKRLALALGLQARASFLEGRTNEAVRRHVEIVLLGQCIAKGGLLVDGITGLTLETLGAASLRADVPAVNAATCRTCARELESAEARRERPERIWEIEKRWSAASFGLVSRLMGIVMRGGEEKRRAEFSKRSNQVIRRTRRVMMTMAGRAFELETGRRAKSPSELVPVYLGTVPIDPVGGAAFSEIPSGNGQE